MDKKSANTRLDFARRNNQFAALALLKDEKNLFSVEKVHLKEQLGLQKEATNNGVCICDRKSLVTECQLCKMVFYGRVSEKCFKHPNVTFLLDFFYCPNCTGPKENLKTQHH